MAAVLAAGLGKRMRSATAKVLHPVGGRPMVLRVLEAVRAAGVLEAVVVTGIQAERVRAVVDGAQARLGPLRIAYAHQDRPMGTGHAVLAALAAPAAGRARHLLVLYGDAPLVDPEEVRGLVEQHVRSGAQATLLTARVADPSGYGRVLRDPSGQVRGIVEERDAGPRERAVDEINTGIGCFEAGPLRAALARCRPANAQGEIYLTDVVALLVADGRRVETRRAGDAEAVLGINGRRQLARAEAALRARTLARLMDAGVTVVDAATTEVTDDCEVGEDTVLRPMTVLEGGTRVGPRCVLGPGAHVRASTLGPEVRVWHAVVEESRLGAGSRVGPHVHLRPGTVLEDGARVGAGGVGPARPERG